MTAFRLLSGLIVPAVLSACLPADSGGADTQKYERHKANRDAYLYQGI